MALIAVLGLSLAEAQKRNFKNNPPQGNSAQTIQKPDTSGQNPQNVDSQKAIVDFEADVMRPVKVADSSAMNLVGNVIFYHNETIISCDSAVRYSDKYMECFGNVIVNKNTTYVYGERADYNGTTNIANIYSPLIKVVDEDVIMYCYNMNFNTLTNIGTFTGGATISQRGNLMESQNGEFSSDTREVTFLRNVEMETSQNRAITSSMMYNMDTEVTSFYAQSYFWNDKEEFLATDYGYYDKVKDFYFFTNNSYIMTDKQEMWGDSISYVNNIQYSTLRRNIQMFDREQNSYLFGDFGKYWGKEEHGFVTDMPSMIGIDAKQDRSDSLFMRGDSIFVRSITVAEFLNMQQQADSTEMQPTETQQTGAGNVVEGSNAIRKQKPTEQLDSLAKANQALKDSIAKKPLTEKELKKRAKAEKTAEKKRISEEKQAVKNAERELKRKEKEEQKAAKRALRKRKIEPIVPLKPVAELIDSTAIKDSLSKLVPDAEIIKLDSSKKERIIRSFSNVRVFRNDFQSVCDSLVAYSMDSTLHMFIQPALWSDQSQITSDKIVAYSKDSQLDRATFEQEPMMVEFVQDSMYNQVAGKYMEAFFKDNGIKMLEVDGNAQTYYYMTEEDSISREIIGFLVADCSKIRFHFVDGQMDHIVYIGDPVYTIYPMDKIPDTQTQFLKNFKWRMNERPKDAKEICDRVIKPSIRESMMKIVKPTFPITKSIMKFKESLLKSGQWKDRNTKLKLNFTPTQMPGGTNNVTVPNPATSIPKVKNTKPIQKTAVKPTNTKNQRP